MVSDIIARGKGMDARSVKTVVDARSIVEERDLSFVKVGVFDIDGVLRGKYLSKDKFFSILESGFGFCDVVLGWDVISYMIPIAIRAGRTAMRMLKSYPSLIAAGSCRLKTTCCFSSLNSVTGRRAFVRARPLNG